MKPDRTLVIPADRVQDLARILRRAIATETAEIRRLSMLATAYHDRPAGSDVDAQLAQARRQRETAEVILAGLEP